MVSLRTNLSLDKSAAVTGGLILVLGVFLAGLAVFDLALPKPSLVLNAPINLEQANAIVHQATIHSDKRRIAITENWLQWALGKLYPPLARTQNADRLLAVSLTECSERSQILKVLAESAGHRCRFVGLNGHVVLEVETDRGWQVADPDYAVVYPVGIESLQAPASTALIRDTLAAAGHAEPQIEQYLGIVQSAEDNTVLPIGGPLSPRLAAVEAWCERLALPLPLGMVVIGASLLLGVKRRTRVPVAVDRQEYRTWPGLTPVACETSPRQPAA